MKLFLATLSMLVFGGLGKSVHSKALPDLPPLRKIRICKNNLCYLIKEKSIEQCTLSEEESRDKETETYVMLPSTELEFLRGSINESLASQYELRFRSKRDVTDVSETRILQEATELPIAVTTPDNNEIIETIFSNSHTGKGISRTKRSPNESYDTFLSKIGVLLFGTLSDTGDKDLDEAVESIVKVDPYNNENMRPFGFSRSLGESFMSNGKINEVEDDTIYIYEDSTFTIGKYSFDEDCYPIVEDALEFYPHPSNCSNFYHYDSKTSEVKHYFCPMGTVWDYKKRLCNLPAVASQFCDDSLICEEQSKLLDN